MRKVSGIALSVLLATQAGVVFAADDWTANLMVGECTPSGVRVGPVEFPMSGAQAPGSGDARRVQVLFRPEDVAVKSTAEALDWPLLGEATVEESGFIGSFERLRLRLPKLPGVRPISPPAAFGGNVFMIEARRSQHQAPASCSPSAIIIIPSSSHHAASLAG